MNITVYIQKRDTQKNIPKNAIILNGHPLDVFDDFFSLLKKSKKSDNLIIATNNITILDILWGLQCIQEFGKSVNDQKRFIRRLFKYTNADPEFEEKILHSRFKLIDSNGKPFKLDVGIDDNDWGGLTQFAGHVSNIVSSFVIDDDDHFVRS